MKDKERRKFCLFETMRSKINVLQQSDYIDVERIYENEKVREFLGGIRQEDSIRVIFEEMLNANRESFYWVVREKQSDSFIGLVSLDLHHEEVYQEISYQFLPHWWGRGYASEVVAVIIDFALNELHFSKVVAETQTANKDSCKLLERLGMKLERIVFRFGAEQSIYSIKKL